MINPILLAGNAIVRAAPAVANVAVRNPVAAAAVAAACGSLATWKAGEIVVDVAERDPLNFRGLVRFAKRKVHNLTADVAERAANLADKIDPAKPAAAAPTVSDKVDAEIEAHIEAVAERVAEKTAAQLRAAEEDAVVKPAPSRKNGRNNGSTPAAKAA